jgi:hypothetical protein
VNGWNDEPTGGIARIPPRRRRLPGAVHRFGPCDSRNSGTRNSANPVWVSSVERTLRMGQTDAGLEQAEVEPSSSEIAMARYLP